MELLESLSVASHQSLFFHDVFLSDNTVNLAGVADSEKQVSRLMKDLLLSHLFYQPKLVEMVAAPSPNGEVKHFKITSRIKQEISTAFQ